MRFDGEPSRKGSRRGASASSWLGFEWAQATLFPCLAVQAPLRVGGARGVD